MTQANNTNGNNGRKPIIRDWSRRGTVHTSAEWLRKMSDGLLVIVIRGEDAVIATHPMLKSTDLDGVWEGGMREGIERMQRLEKSAEIARLLKADREAGKRKAGV